MFDHLYLPSACYPADTPTHTTPVSLHTLSLSFPLSLPASYIPLSFSLPSYPNAAPVFLAVFLYASLVRLGLDEPTAAHPAARLLCRHVWVGTPEDQEKLILYSLLHLALVRPNTIYHKRPLQPCDHTCTCVLLSTIRLLHCVVSVYITSALEHITFIRV